MRLVEQHQNECLELLEKQIELPQLQTNLIAEIEIFGAANYDTHTTPSVAAAKEVAESQG
eukprot:8403791-Lingulodinium_polyedra.AAC.1